LVAILMLTIIAPVAGLNASFTSMPIAGYQDPYPPPNTPGAPSGPPRLYLPLVHGKPSWMVLRISAIILPAEIIYIH
jgi:hypothetical protein